MANQRDAYAKEEVSRTGHFQGMSALPDLGDRQVKLESCEKRRKGGGWVTTPFIFGCEASEALAGFGAHVNLITFLTKVMHMKTLTAATLINTSVSCTTITALMGAFVADAYLGRFTTIAVCSWIILSGMFTLTVIALSKTLHPATCSIAESNGGACEKASSLQMGMLYLAFALIATGSGGIRPCVAPFGASQFDQAHPDERTQLKHYFNWYYFTVTFAALLATTVVVYIQDNVGWALGFGIPAIVFLMSIIFFFGGIRLYRYSPPRGSPFTRMAQVVVAAIRKRKLALPEDPSKLYHGITKTVDDNEELEKPSSDEEGDASSAKRKQGVNDAKSIIESRKPAGREQNAVAGASAIALDEKFGTKAVHGEPNLKAEKILDVSHVENTTNNFDMRKKFPNVHDEKNDADELHLEKIREAMAVGPHRGEADEDGVIVLRHSDQFRFLDRAAIEADHDWKASMRKGQMSKTRINPWKLCPVQQVEELKCMARLAPMWATVIPLAVAMSQGHTYLIQQATTMDRHLGNFVIPAASLSTISIITTLIWLPFYDRKVIPCLRRYTGRERGITFLQKIGVGIALLILAELVTTLVEHKRRRAAAHYGLVDKPHDTIPISAFWLVPQFVIGGLSESFMMVGHMEFFYYMLPEHMTSTGSALLLTATAFGSSLNSVSLNVIQKLTQRRGHPGWLDNNINKAHLDYLYGLLTVWLAVDFVFFLVVARWYNKQRHLSQMMVQSS